MPSRKLPSTLGSLFLIAMAGCGTPFSRQETVSLSTDSPPEKFVIHNRVGDITIKTDPAAKGISASVLKTGRGSSTHEARRALEDIRVTLARTEDASGVVEASVEHPNGNGFRQYCVRWQITMPPCSNILVKNSVGDVHVKGVAGQAEIQTDVGDAIVKGLPESPEKVGPVSITTGVGDIRATQIGNGLRATTGVGEITASGGGKVRLQSDVGDVRLTLLEPNLDTVDCSADIGDVVVYLPAQRKGTLSADTDVGDTVIELGAIPMQNVRHRRKHFHGELGGTVEPRATLQADGGDVIVRSSSEKSDEIK